MKTRNLPAAALTLMLTAAFTPIFSRAGTAAGAAPEAAVSSTTAVLHAETETTAALPEGTYDYEGTFVPTKSPWFHSVGDEPDTGSVVLSLFVIDASGKYNSSVLPFSFSANNSLYSGFYTIDTSAVDNTKAGDYAVRIIPEAGSILTVRTDREYRIRLTDHVSSFTVHYEERPEQLWLLGSNGSNRTECVPDQICMVKLTNLKGAGVLSCTVSDSSVAEIVEATPGQNQILYKIRGLKPGETTVSAEVSDGRTASCTIHVLSLEELYTDTTTDMTTIATALFTGAVPGDVNCSGALEIADAVLLARFLAEDPVSVPAQGLENAETDGDASVLSAMDLARILRMLASSTETAQTVG